MRHVAWLVHLGRAEEQVSCVGTLNHLVGIEAVLDGVQFVCQPSVTPAMVSHVML